jgi:anti-anti-sigma regulatory factor
MRIRVARSGPDVVLTLRGEFDLFTVAELDAFARRAVEAVERSGGTLLIDAAATTFIDVRSAMVLARAAERLGDGRATLVGASSIVLRAIELSERFGAASIHAELRRSA